MYTEEFYRECRDAVGRYLADGVETPKIKYVTAHIEGFRERGADILDDGAVAGYIMREAEGHEDAVRDVIIAGKVSALYSLIIGKREEMRKIGKYKECLESCPGMAAVVLWLGSQRHGNVPFGRLAQGARICPEELGGVLSNGLYFNIREVGGERLVSLSPEGRGLMRYIQGGGAGRQ